MEELHRIHKEVPFGYWIEWVRPAIRILRRWRARRASPLHDACAEASCLRGRWV